MLDSPIVDYSHFADPAFVRRGGTYVVATQRASPFRLFMGVISADPDFAKVGVPFLPVIQRMATDRRSSRSGWYQTIGQVVAQYSSETP